MEPNRTAKGAGRRRFLMNGASLAGLAMASSSAISLGEQPVLGQAPPLGAGNAIDEMNGIAWNLYGRRSRFVTTNRLIRTESHIDPLLRLQPMPNPHRPENLSPIDEQMGIITPSALHYTTNHYYGIPDIDPADHKLIIHGLVDRELVFTLDDLKRLPYITRIQFIECDGNRPNPNGNSVVQTHGRVSCSEWTGVPLSVLFNEAGIKNGASWIVAEGAEAGKHQMSVPLSRALDDVIVAYGQNGEPVRPDQGFPMRLLVPGVQGIINVKWLRRIKVTNQAYHGHRDDLNGYLQNPAVRDTRFGPKSVITFPSANQRLPGPGFYVISGLAWSGGGAIRTVDVSTDGGKTYKTADIVGPRLPIAMTKFALPWRWGGEEAVLQSRCVDETGEVQPTEAEFARFWKLTRQQLYRQMTRLGHCNWIQPWRLSSNGLTTNGLEPVAEVADHG
jgi:sulfane dehydrogenase subunit SoxC